MNEFRFNALMGGQTALARRVYQAVPAAERWGDTKILSEMARLGMPPPSKNVLQACLIALQDSGLIAGSVGSGFIRVTVHRAESKQKSVVTCTTATEEIEMPTNQTQSVAATTVTQPEPLEIIAALASRVAKSIADLRAISDDLEEAALRISDQMERHNEDTKKLEQLRALLKGI